MLVYHGSTEIIKEPDVNHSYRLLDFGQGFYVTTVKEQAEKWAKRKANMFDKTPIVNVYQMNEDTKNLKYLDFADDMNTWIDFVCKCRDGEKDYLKYDLITGKVANDKVFRVVDMYHSGIWDKERALKEMKAYPTYDQTAFITQKSIEQLLTFESYYEV